MRRKYPVIVTPTEEGFGANIPAFDMGTQGKSIEEALEMAKDAISLMGVVLQDDEEDIPEPEQIDESALAEGELLAYVEVDFLAYRDGMATLDSTHMLL